MPAAAEDSLAIAGKGPRVQELIDQFKRSGHNGDYWGRIRLYEDTRLNYWEGQSDDGKKWDDLLPEDKPAFPFNGASDTKVFQSDEVINEQVAILRAAFWRAQMRVQPVGHEDIESASQATTFLDWLKNTRMRCQLEEEVELSAQYSQWFGWCGLHVTWEREIGYRMILITMEDLMNTAAQFSQIPPEQLGQMPPEDQSLIRASIQFPELIQTDPNGEATLRLARYLHQNYIEGNLPPDIDKSEVTALSTSGARKMIKSLAKDGRAEVPVPFLLKNGPSITALRPWRDLVVPPEVTSFDNSPALFVVQYMTEADLRLKELSDDWNPQWIEEAVKTKGRASTWANLDQRLLNTTFQWMHRETKTELIEVIWAYTKQVNDDGVSSVHYSIFSPHIQSVATGVEELAAQFGILNYPYPDYPIVGVRREHLDRHIVSSRGVPDILMTSQREEKVQRDALCDLTSMGVMPPINIPKGVIGQRYKFGPATQNTVTPGREPKFMEVPTEGAPLALNYIELLNRSVARYFGRFTEDNPPAHSQLLMEPAVNRFLSSWSKAFVQAYALCQRFAPEMVTRVTSMPVDPNPERMMEFDFVFHFDVAQLNPDLMIQKLEAFSNLIPEDAGGVIDRAKLVAAKARMIDPALAKELLQDVQPASQRLFRLVQDDVAQMFLGNQVPLGDASNDPQAVTKYQYLQQIVSSNMKYVMALDPQLVQELIPNIQPGQLPQGQPDPIFSKLMEDYIKNLSMGVKQQQNKTIGRIGVAQ